MLLMVILIGSSAVADPLASAEAGQVQCYRPDTVRKTCQSIASYTRSGAGTYDNKALVAVNDEATLETHTSVIVRGDAVCGYIRGEDMLAGTVRLRGNVVPPEEARPVLQKIAESVVPFAGKEVCTRYERSGEGLTAKVSIAGRYRPDQDVAVRWIGPSEGYRVIP
jgi:hypothetical protein